MEWLLNWIKPVSNNNGLRVVLGERIFRSQTIVDKNNKIKGGKRGNHWQKDLPPIFLPLLAPNSCFLPWPAPCIFEKLSATMTDLHHRTQFLILRMLMIKSLQFLYLPFPVRAGLCLHPSSMDLIHEHDDQAKYLMEEKQKQNTSKQKNKLFCQKETWLIKLKNVSMHQYHDWWSSQEFFQIKEISLELH